jgi:ribosome assembly protein SQT1
VYAVAWSAKHPDLVATGGGDDMAFIWRVGTAALWGSQHNAHFIMHISIDLSILMCQVGEDAFEENHGHTLELAGHTDSVVALSFSSSGELLATGGMDGECECRC